MRPGKILLFMAGVLASLAVLCLVLPGRVVFAGTEVRWPTLAEMFGESGGAYPQPLPEEEEESEEASDTAVMTDTVIVADTAVQEAPKPVEVPKIAVDSTTDSRIFLRGFYAALRNTNRHKVRVVHYGDSQIEEDRMTQQIREGLQKRFGGSGVGLMPLAQTIPTNTVRQELYLSGRLVRPQQGPNRYMVYGPKKTQRKDRLYGMMGQVAWMADSLVNGSEEVKAMCKPQVESAHYTTWRVFADSTITYSFSGDTVSLHGRGAVYALSQETDTGVIVDNVPMRGCIGTVFTKIDSAQLASFYREENVQLIILQFGGNAIPFNEKPETIRGFIKGYREQIRYLRSCAPGVSILFVGPSDMMRMKDGAWQSYPMVAYMDKLLRKMALEENIAYFSLFRWMGGEGSMLRWKDKGLAGNDGVHFYRSGAKKAGNAIVEWILKGMDDWTMDEEEEKELEISELEN